MEVWPYGLRRANTDVDALFALIRSRYTHLFELDSAEPVMRPVTHLRRIAQDLEGIDFTDVCLVREK
jgi:hypothetical protein